MPEQPTAYKYFAFICYSRKDSKAAAWLQKRLEWFPYPVKLVPEEFRPPHDRYIRPIYRDRPHLDVTDEHYWTNISRALKESRYLIVLCSPHSAKSEPVNMEVAHFLETHGNNASLVVPIILSGNVTSEGNDGAFCPALRALGDALINRNLATMVPDALAAEQDAWEQGFVSLVSYLLRVQRTAIGDHIQREAKRQAKVIRRWLVVVVMLTIIAAFGWLLALTTKPEIVAQMGTPIFFAIAVISIVVGAPWAYFAAKYRYERIALGATPGGQQIRKPPKQKRGSIFISYRRDDSSGYSGWIADGLIRKFGRRCVFIDVDSITPGESFPQRLELALSQSAVVLVVIGSKWIADPRLGDPKDFVHQEVIGALNSGIKVIPVLVNGVNMPARDSLPENLRELADKQAISMRHQSWPTDMTALVRAVRAILPKPFWRLHLVVT